MEGCHCSNIEIMQLFHELKQKFPVVPDHIVTQCIHQNAHNKELCENELEEENSKYLQHCFPQGLVEKMASPLDDENVYFERQYTRRSLDGAQCSRRKSSSGSDDNIASSIVSGIQAKCNKKFGLNLPPKHAKRIFQLSQGKHTEGMSTLDQSSDKDKRRHSTSTWTADHRGNLEKYRKYDEIVAKGKYKKLVNEFNDAQDETGSELSIRRRSAMGQDASMTQSDERKLCVAQQMLGLMDDNREIDQKKHVSKSKHRFTRSQSSTPSKENRNSSGIGSSKSPNSRRGPKVHDIQKTISSDQSVPLIDLGDTDNKLSTSSHFHFQSPKPVSNTKDVNQMRENLMLDLTPSKFHLNVPSSSSKDMTSVSVLSYSAPSTPMSSSTPLFPPLAVDVNTGSHCTSLSLEPLPSYSFDDENPSRPMTKVTLSLRPPSNENSLLNSPSSGLTYTSYSSKDGVQAQLHISIGSNMTIDSKRNSDLQKSDELTSKSSPLSEFPSLLQDVSANTKHILCAQLERKAMLVNALMCEKERLTSIKRDVDSMENKLRRKVVVNVPFNSTRVSKLRCEIRLIQDECQRMTKAVDNTSANAENISVPLGETDEAFYEHIYTGQKFLPSYQEKSYAGTEPGWICYMCTFQNHPTLPKCEQCDMIRVNLDNNTSGLPTLSYRPFHRNIHIEVTHDRFPTRNIVHSWVV